MNWMLVEWDGLPLYRLAVTVTDWRPDGVPGVEIGVGGFGFAGEELQPETEAREPVALWSWP
ncbi:hypothetical protein [Tunturiibacter gelidiferens]|uniref:Uncharacterized protein n=1 Tax=Tunturiibacter gelidiferens TaxID=3069689 RepID=A0AAU7Z203_9BACT